MNRGQITIEYLLILVVLIILFTNVSTDLMNFTSTNTLQMQTKEIEKTHNQTLNTLVDSISLQAPGAKQTVMFNTPPDCAYNVTEGKITLDCREGTPSENYTGQTIGKIPQDTNVKYSETQIPRGKTGEITIERTGG